MGMVGDFISFFEYLKVLGAPIEELRKLQFTFS